jgi:transposase
MWGLLRHLSRTVADKNPEPDRATHQLIILRQRTLRIVSEEDSSVSMFDNVAFHHLNKGMLHVTQSRAELPFMLTYGLRFSRVEGVFSVVKRHDYAQQRTFESFESLMTSFDESFPATPRALPSPAQNYCLVLRSGVGQH